MTNPQTFIALGTVLIPLTVILVVVWYGRARWEKRIALILRESGALTIYGHEMTFSANPEEWVWRGVPRQRPRFRTYLERLFFHVSVVMLSLDFKSNRTANDDTVALIASLPRIRGVLLNGETFSDASLLALSRCSRLEAIWLINVQVTDEGILLLANARRLRLIQITGGAVTEHGVDSLRTQLPNAEIELCSRLPAE